MKNSLYLWLFVALFAMTSCGKDNVDRPTSSPDSDENINQWMFNYMKTHYLWNGAVKNLKPDYNLDYKAFLSGVLVGVAAQGDVNHDDGHWTDGKRASFYSRIQRFKATTAQMSGTRGSHKTIESLGVGFVYGDILPEENYYHIVVLSVLPGSPADKAGFVRGSIISTVDGERVTFSNFKTLAPKLMNSLASVRVTPAQIVGGKLQEQAELTLTAATFNDNPVLAQKILTATNGDKIGYLCYESFNYYYDADLIAAFAELKTQGVKHLILDLRYNTGGHIVSSAVLGTLVVGATKKDQVYVKTTYNQDRMNAGEQPDFYKIGNFSAGGGSYQPIASALNSALGLTRVYVLCTENTASSSELVINGLRGLDVEVRLIGTTTNGKNVGMEPKTKTKDGYQYEFSPITIYSENAKGFKDYSNGFAPDIYVDEYRYSVLPWGDANDPLVSTALKWINTGIKPSTPVVLKSRSTIGGLKIPMPKKALEGIVVLRNMEEK